MNSKQFNKTVVKEAIDELGRVSCKLEYGTEYDVAPEADQIISECMEKLEELLTR